MERLDKMGNWLKERREKEAKIAQTDMGIALLTIDHLLTLNESEDKQLNLIYRIAHSAIGLCEHKDWMDETRKLYAKLNQ